jgi:hypothetical protein
MGRILKFWRQHGIPIIREYKDERHNPEVERLTFQNDPRRNFYIEGDLIFVGSKSLDNLEKSYPELRQARHEEPEALESLAQIALLFLGVDKKKYKTARRILRITPYVTADGIIETQAVVFLDDSNPIPVGNVHEQYSGKFEFDFRMYQYAACTVPVIEGFLDFAGFVISGGTTSILKKGVKAAARAAAKPLIKAGFRRILRTLAKPMAKALASATREALVAFAKEIAKSLSSVPTAKPGDADSTPESRWKGAVVSAASAAAGAFVTALLGAVQEAVFSKIDVFFRGFGLVKSIKEELKTYFTKQVVALFTTRFLSKIIESLSTAVAAATTPDGGVDAEVFQTKLIELLREALTAPLRSIFDDSQTAIADAFSALVVA